MATDFLDWPQSAVKYLVESKWSLQQIKLFIETALARDGPGKQYEAAIFLIDLFDELDGDPDVELNGDEFDMSYITQDNGVVIRQSLGSEDDEEERGVVVPKYGPDQTQPAIGFERLNRPPEEWGA